MIVNIESKMATTTGDFLSSLKRLAVPLKDYLDYNMLGAYFVSEGLLSVDELEDILNGKEGDSIPTLAFIGAVGKRGKNAEEKMRRSMDRARENGDYHPGLEELYRKLWGQTNPFPESIRDYQLKELEKYRKNTKLLFNKFLPEILNHLDWTGGFPLFLVQEELISSYDYERYNSLLSGSGTRLMGVILVVKAMQRRGSSAFELFVSAVRKAFEDNSDPGSEHCLSVFQEYVQ